LATIISEVNLERDRDIYRLPYPRDAEGRNLFEGALERLDDWERLHPQEMDSVVAFTRALCHEKLAQVEEARREYAAVGSGDPDLSKEAERRGRAMEDLAHSFRPPLDLGGEEGSFPFEAARSRAEAAVEKYTGTRGSTRGLNPLLERPEWEDLALVLAEKQAEEECLRLRSGRASSLDYRNALEETILRFPDSKNSYRHKMRLGLYYEDEMREWIAQAQVTRDRETWELARDSYDKAARIYLEVSRADGYPEKREAQARQTVLEEMARKIDNGLR
jgi:hypothetical protein